MSTLLQIPAEIVSDTDGSAVEGHIAQCGECGSQQFGIFEIDDHLHFQCLGCGTSYCKGKGKCALHDN